ncbi:amidohydrolase family-domain-containing protein [Coprinopsis sp. MPI-PUGE-AT-0042]|nr:amidohydrolase family-domain-containing protein [Coprinopsis sp. MPI-PUGE-AT-0042]
MSKKQEGGVEPLVLESPPPRRSKTFAAAVVLSLTALYCTSGQQSLSSWTGSRKEYDLEIKSPLPEGPYALCSPLDEKGSPTRSIFIVDSGNRKEECIWVKKGRIAGSGSLSDALTPLPDSHCHILEYGFSRDIPLESAKSVQDIVKLVVEYVKSHPDFLHDSSRIIEGFGWNHEGWDVPALPTAADLSSHPLLADRQIILASKDGHASWVSTATLALNGPYPESVEGGVIVRDKATGEPTGVFIDTAQSLITPAVVTPEMQRQRFKNTVKDALRAGLTSLHDAGLYPISLDFFARESKKRGGLPLRVYAMRWFNATSLPYDPSAYWGDHTPKILELDSAAKLASRSVKIFADGALRTAGAALYEPYSDDPTTSGQLRFGAEGFNEVIPRFLKDGWQVNVHAIGDRANGVILDAFQLALDEMNMTTFEGSHLRPRLEHAQIIAKKDIERLTRMGVIASVQPTHINDMWYAEDRLVTLRGMTIDPAYASFTEETLGSLEVGKKADFVILSQDIMVVAPEKILETEVLATVINGEVVYGGI